MIRHLSILRIPWGALFCLGVFVAGCTLLSETPNAPTEEDTTIDTGPEDTTPPLVCNAPRSICDGQCISLFTDPLNCGRCLRRCDDRQVCVQGECVTGCANAQTRCGDVCVSTSSDPLHCGDCDTVCDLNQVCNAGTCAEACNRDLLICDRSCTNAADPAHCGGCDQTCDLANGAAGCVGGNCQLERCFAGYQDCDRSNTTGCETHVLTDAKHCGFCDRACADNEVCSDGVCAPACGNGLNPCGTGCFDFTTSAEHCGSCGRRCSADEACIDSFCTRVCPPGLTDCGGACVNLLTDANHCDSCNNTCEVDGADGLCNGGSCIACPPNFQNCDDSFFNGCETDTSTSNEHCGSCDDPCAGTCEGGTCTTN